MESIQASASSAPQPFKIARSYRMAGAEEATRVQENTDLGFGDLVDLLNPLQHIPIIGSIYRAITGDEIKPEVRVAGDLLYGAATGSVLLSGAISIASMTYEQENGREPSVQIANSLFGDDKVQPVSSEAGTVQLAYNEKAGTDPSDESGFVQQPLAEAGHVQIAALPEKAEQDLATQKKETESAPLGGVRLNNTVYTTLVPRMAAKVTQPEKAPSIPATLSKAGQMDKQTLGLMIHEQAEAQKAGAALPPELVRDMMLMALEKYKTAQTIPEDLTPVQ